jgi:hypothetical protein
MYYTFVELILAYYVILLLIPDDNSDQDAFPELKTRTHNCYAAPIAATQTGRMNGELTRSCPTSASSGTTHLFVLYDFDSNLIHAEPTKSKFATDIVTAYKAIHSTLVRTGLRPRPQRIDKECSALLQDYLDDNQI